MSYQPEERYWTDYLRIALPVTGLLILLMLFWWWGTSIIGGGDDAPPPTQAAAVISEVNAPVASPTATAPPQALTPNVGAPPASPAPAQESAPPPSEAEPTPGEEAPPEQAAEDPPEADPAQSTSIPTLVVGSSATADGTVRVREEPSADSAIVVELDDGDVVTVTGEQVTNEGSDGDLREWYPVETAAGETGFVREDLLQPAE
ncbi:MAG: SH3 domain-containing protein [Chloroflexota bacterium]|nr:SH3 domain-containing protein [Chloroflexota bacterium]